MPLSDDSSNLDVLRACAVLSVYCTHLLRCNHIDSLGPLKVRYLGQTGVLIFFVHTSLVLMMSMDRMKVSGWALAAAFYVRRLFRIYPLSILAVVLVALLHVPRYPLTVHYQWLGWHTFVSNLALTQNLTYSLNFLLPLWSLPLEVQMYVLLPPLFFLVRRYRSWWVPFSLWGAAAIIGELQIHFQSSVRYSLGEFAAFFLSGIVAFVMLRYRSLQLPFWGWPLVIAAAYAFRHVSFQAGWFACLMLGIAVPQFKEVSQPAIKRTAAWIARYSYGIYLSHVVIFWFALVVLKDSHTLTKIAVGAVLSVACPVVLYHALEKPMIKVGVRLANLIEHHAVAVKTLAVLPATPPSPLSAEAD